MPDPTVKPPEETPGRLGKYEVLRRIAAGGMAEIFLARVDAADGSPGVACIKRMLPALTTQPDFVTMFIDEARLAATMQHDNIVRTFEIGQAIEGAPESCFMAMEFLHGEDLRALMRAVRTSGRPPPLDYAVHIISEVLAGLHYAHDQIDGDGNALHVVHRDVSPQNVLVTYGGQVKLLDFGIAKATGRFGETKYGTLKGKIGYMSPEQCRGEPLDRRSDVFTAAILLFELSTGRRLYKGTSEFEVLKLIVEGEVPSPHALDPGYPEELDRVLQRALAKDPAERYQSAEEMAEELAAFARTSGRLVTRITLGGYMAELFGGKIEAWKQAERAGKDLAQHLVEQGSEIALDEDDLLEVPPPATHASASGSDGVPQTVSDTPSARPRTISVPPRLPTPPPMPAIARRPTGQHSVIVAPNALRPVTARVPILELPVPLTPPSSMLMAPVPQAPMRGMARYFVPLAIAASFVFVGSASGVVWVRHAARTVIATAGEPGTVEIATSPPGAQVFLDGKQAARRSPATIDEVESGVPHVLVIELDGYRSEVRHVTVGRRDQLRMTIELEPRTRAER